MERNASEASLSQGDAFESYASSPPEAALNLSGVGCCLVVSAVDCEAMLVELEHLLPQYAGA